MANDERNNKNLYMCDQIEAYFSRITLVTSIDYLKSCKTDCSRGNLSAEVLAELPLQQKSLQIVAPFQFFTGLRTAHLKIFNVSTSGRIWQDASLYHIQQLAEFTNLIQKIRLHMKLHTRILQLIINSSCHLLSCINSSLSCV